MARWATSVTGAAAVLLFVQCQQQFCHHCPMSIFLAWVPYPALLYLALFAFPSWLLWTHYSESVREHVSKACWHHQRCSEKTSRPFQKAAVTAFSERLRYTVCWVERGGISDVDTTVKMTPRRLALHSFMMKSCATIHPHMCSSNI